MMILSQYHIFELDTINIYSVVRHFHLFPYLSPTNQKLNLIFLKLRLWILFYVSCLYCRKQNIPRLHILFVHCTVNALLKIVAEVILIISIANGQIFLSQPNSPPPRSFDCSKMQISTPPLPHPPNFLSTLGTTPNLNPPPPLEKNSEKLIF